MQGAFVHGSPLWWWYDGWIVVPATAAGLLLTLKVLFWSNVSGKLPVSLALLGLAGVTLGALVSLDRSNLVTLRVPAEAWAALSMAGLGVALIGSGALLYRAKGGGHASPARSEGKSSRNSGAKAAAREAARSRAPAGRRRTQRKAA
jgi:hypothetical protein